MANPLTQPESMASIRSLETRVLPVDPLKAGRFVHHGEENSLLDNWEFSLNEQSTDASYLKEAAQHLLTSNTPVAFPTETVYGLGADATRSSAVMGIYRAKQRPSDNPLIVHISSLDQLRGLLRPSAHPVVGNADQRRTFPHQPDFVASPEHTPNQEDPVPPIYNPLIERFWPGPLTILLPNPPNSSLAPEVTAGLHTFGARIPDSLLALSLIRTANLPLAAPSANASTKPSPTTAAHVLHDLNGRIEIILDGGPCNVGVESTVVDGLSHPPTILRPGGVSIDQLRQCKGWENVAIGYKDGSEQGSKPKAPGMKYKHYSPRAEVLLHEAGYKPPTFHSIRERIGEHRVVGIIRTTSWPPFCGLIAPAAQESVKGINHQEPNKVHQALNGTNLFSISSTSHDLASSNAQCSEENLPTPLQGAASSTTDDSRSDRDKSTIYLWDLCLGGSIPAIARGLFSALRQLDEKGADVIFIEGIRDEGDVAAAVMNRLRKAAGGELVLAD
ncbi:MAG: hypothetical protein M1837_006083 [Sclerophora amabilis]|nr:MAG: hypothetical protein M1837_006083 [Sclerophora amabilis]